MNIRETSRRAFREYVSSGRQFTMKLRVWEYVIEHGPCSQADAHDGLIKGPDSSGNITSRFSELKKEGAIIEVGEATNPRTGALVYLWDCTGRGPVKLEKPVRLKCKTCAGKGYIEEQQIKLF
jgi:hypothetical protein